MALIAVAAAVLDSPRLSRLVGGAAGAGTALLLSAPAAWVNRRARGPTLVWIGLISYPLYLWHWPLLVFCEIIKFASADAAGARPDSGSSALLAWVTCRFVETPFRFGRPSGRKISGLCAAMATTRWQVCHHLGTRLRFPAAGGNPGDGQRTDARFAWRFHQCLLDLSQETTFAHTCVERDRRPLVLIRDSTAGALMPGMRKAQETRKFGIAQLTSSSCIPAFNADIASTPGCRAINDKVFALAREIRPDIVVLHGAWEQHLDNIAETVAALKSRPCPRRRARRGAGVERALPTEVLRYFILHRH